MSDTEKVIRGIIDRRVKEWLHPYTHLSAAGMRPTTLHLITDDDDTLSSSPASMIYKELEKVCTDLTLKSEYPKMCAYCRRPAETAYGG